VHTPIGYDPTNAMPGCASECWTPRTVWNKATHWRAPQCSSSPITSHCTYQHPLNETAEEEAVDDGGERAWMRAGSCKVWIQRPALKLASRASSMRSRGGEAIPPLGDAYFLGANLCTPAYRRGSSTIWGVPRSVNNANFLINDHTSQRPYDTCDKQ
jgi:hypothetical protein